jgi:DNA-binding transcriptional MerR regulator
MRNSCAHYDPLVPWSSCDATRGASEPVTVPGVGEETDQPLYSIGAVAKMLAVPSSTLRAWEERYGVMAPHRSSGSQRLYSRRQIEQLRYVKAQIDSGLSAADAHRLLREELGAGRVPVLLDDDPPAPRPLVLIAERDPYAAELAEYFLRTEGYDVFTAMDANQARAAFDERSPHLVIIDLLISGGAGFRLCREFSSGGATQVLAVSALESADEAMHAGGSAFLHKPLEPLQLVSAVRDLLGTSALARPARHRQVQT